MAEDSSKTSEGTSEEEELDPRVQEELEKLNLCTEDINQLELQLEDANALFRTLLSDSTHQVRPLRNGVHRLLMFTLEFTYAQ